MTSRLSFLIIPLLFLKFSFAQDYRNVLYGQHTEVFKEDALTTQLFLDKEGNYYPNSLINDDELRKTASIRAYFEQHPSHFLDVTKSYGLSFNAYSEENFNSFQEVLMQSKLNALNHKIKDYEEVFIVIHGFRKPMVPTNGDTSSHQDNMAFRESLSNKDNIYFVEVYWDCMYDKRAGLTFKYNKTLFKLFENQARANAVNVGYSLRKVVSKIDKENITVVAHSLGARVATSLLFNSYDGDASKAQQKLKTPSQSRVDIILIAPAISKSPFKAYYERVSKVDFKKKDNYFLAIVYNRKDFVLLKRENKLRLFGPGPRRYGNTSLGCNARKEAYKLRDDIFVEFPNSEIQLINAPIGQEHFFKSYANAVSVKHYFDTIASKP